MRAAALLLALLAAHAVTPAIAAEPGTCEAITGISGCTECSGGKCFYCARGHGMAWQGDGADIHIGRCIPSSGSCDVATGDEHCDKCIGDMCLACKQPADAPPDRRLQWGQGELPRRDLRAVRQLERQRCLTVAAIAELSTKLYGEDKSTALPEQCVQVNTDLTCARCAPSFSLLGSGTHVCVAATVAEKAANGCSTNLMWQEYCEECNEEGNACLQCTPSRSMKPEGQCSLNCKQRFGLTCAACNADRCLPNDPVTAVCRVNSTSDFAGVNPCQNTGNCFGLSNYTCFCQPGFSGTNCANGGTCTVSGSSYACTCPAGFAGRACESSADEVAASPSPPPSDSTSTAGTAAAGSSSESGGGGSNTGAIAGAAAALVAGGVFFLRRRRRLRAQQPDPERKGGLGPATSAGRPDAGTDTLMSKKMALSAASAKRGSLATSQSTSSKHVSVGHPELDTFVSGHTLSQVSNGSCLRDDTLLRCLKSQLAASYASSPRSSNTAGRVDAEAWEIQFQDITFERVIGTGSFGKVFLATWHSTPVACKLLLPGSEGSGSDTDSAAATAQRVLALSDSPLMTHLEQEASLMAGLRHPNICQFYALCRLPPCLLAEYCAKGSLAEVLHQARGDARLAAQLTWRRRLAMALDASRGCLYLHSRSPPIVDENWRVKVADFNLSKVYEDAPSAAAA
ncbi:hypothetical protein ABPG75_011105 [Micractinium tetrahymenae]